MKIKPLIKTHWVASQNPLMVPTGGLRRLVLTLPPELMNPQFSFNPEDAEELPPESEVRRLTPETEEAYEARAHSYALSRDLFWNLFSGHEIVNPSHGTSWALQKLVQSLEFHFDDGQCLSLKGISRRPELPRFLNPKYYLQDPSCNWERVLGGPANDLMRPLKITALQKKHLDFQKTWMVVLEILAWALQRKRQVGDLEVLWAEPHRRGLNGNRFGHSLEDVEFHKELPLAATVRAAADSAQLQIWQGFQSESPEGVLRFHAIDALVELENYFLGPESGSLDRMTKASAEESQILKSRAPQMIWEPRFAVSGMDTQGILRTLHQLEKSIGEQNIYFVNHALVTSPDFRPALRFQESEGSLQMAVSFRIASQELEHFNFPPSLFPTLSPFFGGLDHFLGLERKEAASKQFQFRANDLIFLRHQGLVLFCLFELMNWILRKPLSSGEEIEFSEDVQSPEFDRQFERVIGYFQSSIPALIGKPGIPYKELVSSRAQSYFLDFVDRIFHHLMQDRSFFFLNDQVLEIRGVQTQVLPVLRFLILHWIETSQGKFLLRAQSPLGEAFKNSLSPWTEPQIRSLDADAVKPKPFWVDIGRFEAASVSLLFDLMDQGFLVELNGNPLTDSNNPFEFVFSVRDATTKEDSNWFDLDPEIFFNGKRISTEEVKLNFGQGQAGFIEYQGQFYRIDKKLLPSLKSLQRFWNKIKGLRHLTARNSFGDKVYRLEKSQALELLMLRAQGFEVKVEGEWKRIFDYFEKGLGTEKVLLPETIERILLPHQREGVQWLHDLYELKLGAILADEMGLGKTFQVLSFLVSLQERNLLKKSLIIVPTSLVYNWLEEKKKFAPDLPVRIYHTPEQAEIREALQSEGPLVVIATYGLLVENLQFFQSQEWNVLAFDEAQNIKNITSMRSVAARKLNARFKISITGTPMENNYLEFYSLCDLVVPGSLGPIDLFRKEYVNREVRSESLRELRLISKPLLLRRTKLQVKLTLPNKTVEKIFLPFAAQQKEIYKKMAMTFSRQVEDLIREQGEKKAQIAMFAALMRLRQICSDPAAVPGVVYEEQPAKVEHFLEALQDHLENQESIVVFTQFLSTLGRIEAELLKRKVPTFTLQGSVSSKERIRLISEFQNSPEPGVMLMTLKTGGVGLNLTKASVVYHLEPWWNPAVENQATDRAHRMGQKKEVKVYNLLIEGSLEERISDLKLKKQDSFDRLFNVDEQWNESSFEGSHALSREDFVYLLK